MLTEFFLKIVIKIHVFFYRQSNGSLGGSLGGADILLLTSTGRRTRKERITPLSFMMEGSNYVIIASYGGNDKNPSWFHNLRGNQDVTIRIKDIVKEVKVTVASKDERNRLWPIITEWSPQYAKYQEKTSRKIPVVILSPKN